MVTLVNIMLMNGWVICFTFHVNRPSQWDKAISDSDLENGRSRSRVWSKGKVSWPYILLSRFLLISHQSDQQSPRYGCFVRNFERFKAKVLSEVKCQGHISYQVSNWCTSFSFHINRTNHSWDMMFDFEKTHPEFYFKKCQNESFQQNVSKIESCNNHD